MGTPSEYAVPQTACGSASPTSPRPHHRMPCMPSSSMRSLTASPGSAPARSTQPTLVHRSGNRRALAAVYVLSVPYALTPCTSTAASTSASSISSRSRSTEQGATRNHASAGPSGFCGYVSTSSLITCTWVSICVVMVSPRRRWPAAWSAARRRGCARSPRGTRRAAASSRRLRRRPTRRSPGSRRPR